MLVKLGDMWIDPNKVWAINPIIKNEQSIIELVTENQIYDILTNENNKPDTFAAIINNTSQSYGGEDEKSEGK